VKKTLVSAFGLSIVSAAVLLAAPHAAHAVPIAIIDSGTALDHPDLVNHTWTNIYDWEDGVDNDDNGYIDDVHGWNFADGTNKLYDKKLLGSFSPDVYTYFALQTKYLKGTATATDIAWLKAKSADTAFVAQLEAFGNFVHGTHVAGIASKNSPGAMIMPMKIIGGSTSEIMNRVLFSDHHAMSDAGDKTKEELITLALEALATAQGAALAPEGQYANMEGAKVANCSFGSSGSQIKQLIGPIITKVMGRPLTDTELNVWTTLFLNKANDAMRDQFIGAAPDTLFVIAAGNDGTSNDLMPSVPANVKADNTITVAATNGLGSLAVFSNYGTASVDVAAPGVGILSTIPGNTYLTLSGTSQATPFVTNIAGQIRDAQPSLTIPQVKQILMGTVDYKDYLKDKVASGGIVNPGRALLAAKLTASYSIDTAMNMARVQVTDMNDSTMPMFKHQAEPLYVTPLTQLLKP
jgi:subtilisin family serine protease